MDDLLKTVNSLGAPHTVLVGDFILDRYVYGHVERINPEAPVPVLHIAEERELVGGAGNVAAAVPALGAKVSCVGVLGQDSAGKRLQTLVQAAGADTSHLIVVPDRCTAVKTRYVGLAQHRRQQQMLRVDDESITPLTTKIQNQIAEAVQIALADASVLIVEDYNKGVLTDISTPNIIANARANGKTVVVDPACISDFRRYRGTTIIKPNRYEASVASGINIVDDQTLEQAATNLIQITEAEVVVISLDREGMYLFRAGTGGVRIPHQCPRSVYDVTGAGDETMAVLAIGIAAGCPYEEAVSLANIAGGLEVEQHGFVPITKEQIQDEIHRMVGLRSSKLVSQSKLKDELTQRHTQGDVIVFTNGIFDLLHIGHIRHLRKARELGSCLVVALNSDASVTRLRGQGRPIIGSSERAEMLAALEWVDYVTVFDEDTPANLLEEIRPDILVKGKSGQDVIGRELLESYGGTVVELDLEQGQSTTAIINRIVAHADQAD